MAKRPKSSRWRRLPGGLRRFHESKPDDPALEPQRLLLYLPGAALDRAEAQALRAGIDSVQKYCEALLLRAIEAEHDREKIEDSEARRGRLEGLLAIANDPEYLAEWTASMAQPRDRDRERDRDRDSNSDQAHKSTAANLPTETKTNPPDPITPGESGMTFIEGPAEEVVFRHAALGANHAQEDPGSFLETLRRGEPIASEVVRELLQALVDLENQYRDAPNIDRRIAYALHRLAFEGQVLVTDAWPNSASANDETTINALRLVQERVDRVLSGEDIRYYSSNAEDASNAPSDEGEI